MDPKSRLQNLLKILEKRDPTIEGLAERIASVKQRIAKLTDVENLIRNPMPGPLEVPKKKKKKIIQEVEVEDDD
jgi:hypothetical protein